MGGYGAPPPRMQPGYGPTGQYKEEEDGQAGGGSRSSSRSTPLDGVFFGGMRIMHQAGCGDPE